MQPKPGDLICHYRLIEKISEGGMGVVWKAMDTTLERPVAIKVLPNELVEDRERLARFEHEARILAALNHPSIVTVYSVESDGALRFLTMEWVPGRTLDEIIPPTGVTLELFLRITPPIVEGIITAHERGVTHRDLKPTNVMLSESGRLKLLDFGLARRAVDATSPEGSQASTRSVSATSGVAGTLQYMSPEQLRGQALDGRSDIFSLGVLFYELATGTRPFGGESVADVSAAILRDVPRPVRMARPDLPEGLERLIQRCLEKEPAKRFQTASEILMELETLKRRKLYAEDGVPSIAVLPFADMSKDHDQSFLCEGVADEITNALTKIRGLHVVSRASALQFRGTGLDPREIGRRLGVRHLLEGSVRKAGDRVRIATELIDVENGFTLWSEKFDRGMSDIFAIQDEIADSVAQALKVSLSPRERRATRSVATTDVQAYEYYLRGRKFLFQHSKRGILSARQMFERAIAIDPTYALAHAGIADCSSFVYLYVDRAAAYRNLALEASERALQLDPDLAPAHVAHGVAHGLFGRSEHAIAEYERAIELDPRSFDAYFFYAREVFMRGDLEESARLFERAVEVNPEDYQAPGLLGQIYADLHREEESRIMRRQCIRNAEERLKRHPDDTRALYMSANAMLILGDAEGGLARARAASDLDPNDCMMLYNVGCIFSLAGMVEEAISFLERSVMVGNIQKLYFMKDSNLDPLRGHPRFRALMATLEKRQPDVVKPA